MPEEKEELPFEGCCDLIERELRNALQDITYIPTQAGISVTRSNPRLRLDL